MNGKKIWCRIWGVILIIIGAVSIICSVIAIRIDSRVEYYYGKGFQDYDYRLPLEGHELTVIVILVLGIIAVIAGIMLLVEFGKSRNEHSEDWYWYCSCGRKNKENDSFCPNCGQPRPAAVGSNDNWRCSCGTINKDSYMFCIVCGKPKPKD